MSRTKINDGLTKVQRYRKTANGQAVFRKAYNKYRFSEKGKRVRQAYRIKYRSTDEYKKKHNEMQLKRNFNITIQEYNEMLDNQNHCCAICSKHESKQDRKLAIDHDHKTGKIRALLCNSCNRGLGFFEDSEEILIKASDYLRKHKGAK